jgi:hypothetical protein
MAAFGTGLGDDIVDTRTLSKYILTSELPLTILTVRVDVSLTTDVSVSVLAPVPLGDNLKLVSIDSFHNTE